MKPNKDICDDILRYGTILNDDEYNIEGDSVRQYRIKYEGEIYNITKINGEWDYLSRDIWYERRLKMYRSCENPNKLKEKIAQAKYRLIGADPYEELDIHDEIEELERRLYYACENENCTDYWLINQ